MLKVKYYTYEILSISIGLALLAFFGTFTFLPMEVMLMGELQTWYWVFIFLTLGSLAAFFLISLHKDKALLIMRVVDPIIAVLTIFMITSYLTFTSDLLEPWLIQASWYFRYNGLLIGLTCVFILIKCVAGVSFLITKFASNSVSNNLSKEKMDLILKKITLSIFIVMFSFYIMNLLSYRYFTLLHAFIFIFIIQCLLIIISPFLYLQKDHAFYSSFVIITVDSTKIKRSKSSIKNLFTNKLKSVNSSWGFFKVGLLPFLVFTILAIVIMLLMPLEVSVQLSMPFDPNAASSPIQVVQVSSIALIGFFFIALLYLVSGGRSYLRFSDNLKNSGLKKLKISGIGVLDGMKWLGLIFAFALLSYFFNYPIYFPLVISYVMIYGIFGAILYFLFGTSEKSKLFLYTLSILLLLINLIFMYVDGFENSINYYDMYPKSSVDILFPFKYIHSTYHLLFVGIPLGIISSDLFISTFFKDTNGGDSTMLAICVFAGAAMIHPFNWLINIPGSAPPLEDQTHLMFKVFTFGLMAILILGLSYHYLTEYLIPYFQKKKSKRKRNFYPRSKKAIPSEAVFTGRENHINGKKIMALSLSAFILISLFGGIAIASTHQDAYKKPLLANSPGNYYLWYQPSTERVTKDFNVALESSPFLDPVELSLAKNEYEAFQIVWRPTGEKINDLSYKISDFIHESIKSEKIDANLCSLRYMDYIIQSEFPDILKPFDQLDLEPNTNTVFWFSLKTPYDLLAGNYFGNITFTFNEIERVNVPVRLKIWNFAVPKTRHLRNNIKSLRNNQDVLDNYFYHRMNDYGESVLGTFDLNQLNTEKEYTCHLNKTTGEWIFNWTWWDNKTQYKLDNGMNAFRTYYPLGIGGGPKGGRDPYIEDETKMAWLKSFLAEFQDHMEEKGWLKYAYFYFIDEFQFFIPSGYTREQYFERLGIVLKEMKEAAPKLKIMCTAPPTEELEGLSDYFDIYCPVSTDRDKERWDERKDAGCEMWMYACVGPMSPYPNSHLYNRLYETRILLWQSYLYNLDGFLYWHSMYYGHGKYGVSYNGYGDGWFIHEIDGKLYDSSRWENYLQGNEDFEFLWLANAALDYLEENPTEMTADQIQAKRTELNNILISIVGERYKYCDHPSILERGRVQIGELLNELSALLDLNAIGEAPWEPPYYSLSK